MKSANSPPASSSALLSFLLLLLVVLASCSSEDQDTILAQMEPAATAGAAGQPLVQLKKPSECTFADRIFNRFGCVRLHSVCSSWDHQQDRC